MIPSPEDAPSKDVVLLLRKKTGLQPRFQLSKREGPHTASPQVSQCRMLHVLLALAWRGPPVTYRVGTRAALAATLAVDDSCVLDDPSVLCAYDPLAIDERFADRQSEVAGRIGSVGLAAFRVWCADDDGATLRSELSKLGPVFCKVGQTMATRPDIVGLETSRNLGQLQDAMEPEPDPATAMATLRAALGGESMVSAKLRNISAAPVAAAPNPDPDH